MTWSDFYLLCFLVGLTLTVLSFVAGAVHFHLPFKMHLPFHGGHAAGGHIGHGHVGHAASHGASHGSTAGAKGGTPGSHIPWFNATTAMAFLAWFGGVGYILTTHSRLMAMASLSIATLAGLFAGYVVFRFMTRLMRDSQGEMYDWDYRLEGVVGTVSTSIREKGTGEVIFERDGARRSVSARCESGTPITKDREVVIERYEDGIAYVRPWEEFTK